MLLCSVLLCAFYHIFIEALTIKQKAHSFMIHSLTIDCEGYGWNDRIPARDSWKNPCGHNGRQLYGDVIITVVDKTGCLSRDTMVLGEHLILGSGCGIHSAK